MVELVQTLSQYETVQIQQVRLRARYLPRKDQILIDKALNLIRQARIKGEDPVLVMETECGFNKA